MFKKLFLKFKSNPIRYIQHLFRKYVIAPKKYARSGDYDAANYWKDRFEKLGPTLTAVGDEGLPEEENQKMYEAAKATFVRVLNGLSVDISQVKILEIGTGSGFFTQIMHQEGARNYQGLDITDAFFEQFKAKFPGFSFIQKDITQDALTEKYDLILFIDVLEHIVTEAKITQALKTIQEALADKGLLILAPVMPKARKEHFHLRLWTQDELLPKLEKMTVRTKEPFRYGELMVLQKEKV